MVESYTNKCHNRLFDASASAASTPAEDAAPSTFNNLAAPLSKATRRMSTFFMDKIMSPSGSRRNSSIVKSPSFGENDMSEDKDGPINSNNKKKNLVTAPSGDDQCKQYVQNMNEDENLSPTRDCSTCLDCSM